MCMYVMGTQPLALSCLYRLIAVNALYAIAIPVQMRLMARWRMSKTLCLEPLYLKGPLLRSGRLPVVREDGLYPV